MLHGAGMINSYLNVANKENITEGLDGKSLV